MDSEGLGAGDDEENCTGGAVAVRAISAAGPSGNTPVAEEGAAAAAVVVVGVVTVDAAAVVFAECVDVGDCPILFV